MMSMMVSTAGAEQPRAEQYRQIFSSGNFYVEYEDRNVRKVIAEAEGRRMARTALTSAQAAAVTVLNPIGALFGGGADKYPEFMYSNGRYYKFAEKNVAFMLEEDRLDEENLNPREGWRTIDKSLSLPDELAVFNWTDRFHRVSSALNEPRYVESVRKTVDGREYDCDRYEATTNNRSGARIIFDMLYADGELVMAQSLIGAGAREYEINRLEIKKITGTPDKKDFKVDAKAKVYAAGIGDMNDLLESPVLIGKLEEIDQAGDANEDEELESQSAVEENVERKIDAYRRILLGGRYTIRCENLTPTSRVTNRTKMELHGKSGLAVDANDFFVNRPVSDVVVSDGDDRYEEVGYEDFHQCRLVRGGENFFFTKYIDAGAVTYFGNKKGKVAANGRNYMAELIDGASYGDEDFSRLLNAMVDGGDVRYEFVTDGVLDGGLTYEDYKASNDGELSAIRYYFEGARLVKIAFASYGRDARGRAQGSKCIVRINEFRAEPDVNLLRLPEGLEDVTKR